MIFDWKPWRETSTGKYVPLSCMHENFKTHTHKFDKFAYALYHFRYLVFPCSCESVSYANKSVLQMSQGLFRLQRICKISLVIDLFTKVSTICLPQLTISTLGEQVAHRTLFRKDACVAVINRMIYTDSACKKRSTFLVNSPVFVGWKRRKMFPSFQVIEKHLLEFLPVCAYEKSNLSYLDMHDSSQQP